MAEGTSARVRGAAALRRAYFQTRSLSPSGRSSMARALVITALTLARFPARCRRRPSAGPRRHRRRRPRRRARTRRGGDGFLLVTKMGSDVVDSPDWSLPGRAARRWRRRCAPACSTPGRDRPRTPGRSGPGAAQPSVRAGDRADLRNALGRGLCPCDQLCSSALAGASSSACASAWGAARRATAGGAAGSVGSGQVRPDRARPGRAPVKWLVPGCSSAGRAHGRAPGPGGLLLWARGRRRDLGRLGRSGTGSPAPGCGELWEVGRRELGRRDRPRGCWKFWRQGGLDAAGELRCQGGLGTPGRTGLSGASAGHRGPGGARAWSASRCCRR